MNSPETSAPLGIVVVRPGGPATPLADAMTDDALASARAVAGPRALAADEAGLADACRRLDVPALVIVRADAVTMPAEQLRAAAADLAHLDVVVGPADDGSVALLGLTRRAVGLVDGAGLASWEATHAAAKSSGRAARVLPPWWRATGDIGRARLERALLGRAWPRRTAEVLRRARIAAANADIVPDTDADARLGPWRRIASRPVYATPWLRIREDLARMPDGRVTTYSVVDCGQCVGVLPFVDEETVLLVRQYRYVAGHVTWEMPTGGVDGDEPVEAAARRELAEEAQVTAGRLEPLGAFHTSKSVMDETAWLFTAHDLTPTAATGDDTAFIATEPVPLDRAVAMALDGTITDAMTIIALLRVALVRGPAPPSIVRPR